jgi:hypothetical protein
MIGGEENKERAGGDSGDVFEADHPLGFHVPNACLSLSSRRNTGACLRQTEEG